MVTIPLFDGTFYTAEARRQVGYDERVPLTGVVLHHVDPERGDRRAQVVDVDDNGDPNDEGAAWTPGEVFEDGLHGVTLSVVEPDGEAGYRVEVSRGWWLDVEISGVGRVTGSAGEIDCAFSCANLLAAPGALVLEAVPGEGMIFSGWSGACSGTGPCSVTLGTRQAVAAEFVPPLAIVSGPQLPTAMAGSWYQGELKATGGTGVYLWRLTGGTLPKGVALDSIQGTLAGIPEESGDFSFQITTTSRVLTASASFHLTVEIPALQRQTVIDELLVPGSALTWDQRRYLDIVGNANGKFDLGDVQLFLRRNGG
jgi:hypothetical protein